jgi:NADH-quinone oxidoreductase subunit J
MIGFVILAVVMLLAGIGVVTFRQPVHAALSLVVTLLALAVTYVTLQAHFLAAIQVIVYAGAIMVLFLFVIMLLNVQGQEPPPRLRWIRPLAYAAALLVAAGIAITAFVDRSPLPSADQVAALQGGSAEQVGTLLFSHYVLAFQLVGVLLLTGIVAAVSLAQRGNPAAPAEPRGEAAPERELTHG